MDRFRAIQEYNENGDSPTMDTFDAALLLIEVVGGLISLFLLLFATGWIFYAFGPLTGFGVVTLFWGPLILGLIAEYNVGLWGLIVLALMLAISGLFLYIAFTCFGWIFGSCILAVLLLLGFFLVKV